MPSDILDFFARRGREGGVRAPHNGLKVRRIVQIVQDLATRPLDQMSVLDLGCGEGVYTIETALRGPRVLGVDARPGRMNEAARIAERLGITTVRFEQNDVRNITADSCGRYDVVYFLGMLYHLDVPDAFHVLEHLHDVCREWLVIDTHVSLAPQETVAHRGRTYMGTRVREHDDEDPEPLRRTRELRSIDNTFSFHFATRSLIRLLVDLGFTSVFECHVPLEPLKPANRVTLVARKGRPVTISTYPWVNGKTADQIDQYLKAEPSPPTRDAPSRASLKGFVKWTFRRLGYEIKRVDTS
ncbi:MAG TPA: class I SAM-dependent methyltransferase [Candidatus Limnocylindrales bacterium]|nr:class I SAM-dependent methyltransferase [Candidatus Limnocylindrales bacterium]